MTERCRHCPAMGFCRTLRADESKGRGKIEKELAAASLEQGTVGERLAVHTAEQNIEDLTLHLINSLPAAEGQSAATLTAARIARLNSAELGFALRSLAGRRDDIEARLARLGTEMAGADSRLAQIDTVVEHIAEAQATCPGESITFRGKLYLARLACAPPLFMSDGTIPSLPPTGGYAVCNSPEALAALQDLPAGTQTRF